MPKREAEVLSIFRRLSPERRDDLLAWVHLAYTAENSARKSLGPGAAIEDLSPRKPPEYSGRNIL
jgi:hypothetical protein